MIIGTSALSAMADGDSSLDSILRAAEVIALPVITLGLYRYGLRQSVKRSQYDEWLAALITECLVLDIDAETTEHFAAIQWDIRRAGTPIPVNDIWIAALARQHALPVLSRDRRFDNVSGFRRISW